jgi:hypothetical protein
VLHVDKIDAELRPRRGMRTQVASCQQPASGRTGEQASGASDSHSEPTRVDALGAFLPPRRVSLSLSCGIFRVKERS